VVGPVSRRGLLGAGAAAGLALAGCGVSDDEPPPDAELLAPSLAAALALVDAYERIGGRLGRELGAREREHVQRLRAVGVSKAEAPAELLSGPLLQQALALEQTAMRAHVRAVGLVRGAPNRALAAELLADDARHESELRSRMGHEPLPSAFPDGVDA